MPTLPLALLAGGISFLPAKMSGASTRNALLAGVVGGGTSFGFGTVRFKFSCRVQAQRLAKTVLLQNLWSESLQGTGTTP